MTVAEQIYGSLGPFAEDDETGDLAAFTGALTRPMERVYSLIGEEHQEDPWSIVLNADRCPTECLPWLALWEGVDLTPDMTEGEQRQAIKDREGEARGRPATIRARVERTLTGSKRVVIRERTPGPYNLYIRTIGMETPNPDLTLAAILQQKPAGLTLDYAAATGLTYIDLAADYMTYGDVAASGLSYRELSETLP